VADASIDCPVQRPGWRLQDLARGKSVASAFEQRFSQTYDGFLTNLEAAH